MKLATYLADGMQHVGVVTSNELVTDLDALVPSGDLVDAITVWDQIVYGIESCKGIVRDLRDVELLAPIPRPRRNVFCVGKNYREHAEEFAVSGYDASTSEADAQSSVPDRPVVFTKANSSVIGPDAAILSHSTITKEVDYEAELAVIIGRPGSYITAVDALNHVWGYTVINDVTARDRQRDHRQWFLGKSLDSFCPMGPFAVPSANIDLSSMHIESRVNGELRQSAPLSDMIFDVPSLIETISAGLTLQPGDIIATGTPAGVGISFNPPRFLQSGDVVEMTITGLGTLRNSVL